MQPKLLTLSLAIIVGGGIFSFTQCKKKDNPDAALLNQAKTFFAPIAMVTNPDNPITPEKVALGKQLYFDTRLSVENNVSCNTCHPLNTVGAIDAQEKPISGGGFGMDNVQFSFGSKNSGTIVNQPRNTPTSIASSLVDVQFWDGRARNVELQAIGPIISGTEHGMANRNDVLTKLIAIQGYNKAFTDVFGTGGLTYENIGNAIGAFERQELIPETAFDRFLKGDVNALTATQKAGLREFIAQKCTNCHLGAALADNVVKFQKFGLFNPNKNYWEFTGTKPFGTGVFENNDPYDKGVGRANADQNAFPDKGGNVANSGMDYFFKIPGLRNVEKTSPYFHDGSVVSLTDAVNIMADAQFGVTLTAVQTSNIVDFLSSLTAGVNITAPTPLN